MGQSPNLMPLFANSNLFTQSQHKVEHISVPLVRTYSQAEHPGRLLVYRLAAKYWPHETPATNFLSKSRSEIGIGISLQACKRRPRKAHFGTKLGKLGECQSRAQPESIQRLLVISVLPRIRRKVHRSVRWLRDLREHFRVVLGPKRRLAEPTRIPQLIVSLTSFPARIGGAWLAIESIYQQTILPDRILLTLAKEEFPGQKIPFTIQLQVYRGLEIIWVEKNGRSFDKLLPARIAFPSSIIVTVDDDKLLPQTLLADLMDSHAKHPTAIIGARGWEMAAHGGAIEYGRGWTRASANTPSQRLFMPGNGGVLYPGGSLDNRLNDIKNAMQLAPTADDIWFWGVATARGTPLRCLGKGPYTTIFSQRNSPALGHINSKENGPQFQAILDHFSIRNRVVAACAAG